MPTSTNTPECLAEKLGKHHQPSGVHALRTRDLAHALARTLGFSAEQSHDIALAALLHDIGKTGIPPEVLDAPRALTSAEWERVRQHPDQGAEIARLSGCPREICSLIRGHHERADGTGYPNGLIGAEISIAQRVVIVADVWDATGALRPYDTVAAPHHSERIAIIRELGFTDVAHALVHLVGDATAEFSDTWMGYDLASPQEHVCEDVFRRLA